MIELNNVILAWLPLNLIWSQQIIQRVAEFPENGRICLFVWMLQGERKAVPLIPVTWSTRMREVIIRPYWEKSCSSSFWVMVLGSPLTYRLASRIEAELGRAYETCKTKKTHKHIEHLLQLSNYGGLWCRKLISWTPHPHAVLFSFQFSFWRIVVQAIYNQLLAFSICSIQMPEVVCAPVLSHTVLVVCILALTWSS